MFPPRNKRLLGVFLGWFAVASAPAWAKSPAAPADTSPVLCGTLETSSGDLQILDSARTRLLEALPGSGLPCGAWISVGTGESSWAVIRHRDGVTLHAAAGTFLALDAGSDQVILYRGDIFGRSDGGTPELRVITANAKIRIPQGMAMVTYGQADEETQIVSLEGSSSIENRFVPRARVSVKEGEASSLNFKLLRTVPSAPKAIASSDLRAKLKAFPIDDRIHNQAIHAAYQRAERKFASTFDEEMRRKAEAASSRAPASEAGDPAKAEAKAKAAAAQERRLKAHWIGKIVGGAPMDEKDISSRRESRKPASTGSAEVEDTEARFIARKKADETKEKKRLLEELSKLKPGE